MIVPKYSREIPQRFRLESGRCNKCAYLSFPPRLVCPECGGREFTTINLKPSGTVLTHTIIEVAADNFATQTPFAVAIIETEEGARMTIQIVDCDPKEVEIGKKVKLVLRRIQKEGHAGILQYGYKGILIRE